MVKSLRLQNGRGKYRFAREAGPAARRCGGKHLRRGDIQLGRSGPEVRVLQAGEDDTQPDADDTEPVCLNQLLAQVGVLFDVDQQFAVVATEAAGSPI